MDPQDPPIPSQAFLEALVLKGLRRGIPVQDAEDLVMDAWDRARRAFDADRGSFDALLLRVVENAYAGWWRAEVRAARTRALLVADAATSGPELVRPLAAAGLQQRVLDALTAEERRLFTTWALSHHLPRGAFPAPAAARSLGLSPGTYDHARRALSARIHEIVEELGADVRELLDLQPDQGTAHAPRRSRR